ncbi:zeatin O-glucosyltransferase-like [Amaranthus tricolor]|uniref:zeatin O-glucosyltransferase-like n=1 Tax=Amaranthus tricolor TaxID=29722 RepID=UPI002585B2D5|nr:zeatin O-glucosyltransferase-like [Amaranthus tricolor]
MESPKNFCQNIPKNNPNDDDLPPIAVVMVPLPAQSHLNQLLHLSQQITSHGIPVHFASSPSHNTQAKLRLHGWDPQSLKKIHFHDFDLPPLMSPLPSTNHGYSIPFPPHFYPLFKAATHFREPICNLLQKLSTMFKRVVVIHDIIIASVVQDVKNIPNAESYSVIPISAFTLFFDFWETMDQKPFDLNESDIPKCIPSKQGCTTPEIDEYVATQFEFLGLESGRIYNTSRIIEGKYVELMEKLTPKDEIKHFALGPFNPVGLEKIDCKINTKRHPCLKWLDQQENDSVIYISFGSSTSLKDEQIRELAIGLEKSEQKFLWVLRNCDTADVLTQIESKSPQLPEEYEERMKNRGIIVRDWAPQLEILGHPSVGGFMSHCGWNSCIEGISLGVGIVAWPMHSDQPRNAVLITEVLRIGTLIRDWDQRDELVTSCMIEKAVKMLMDTEKGEMMRKRAVELGNDVRRSVDEDGVAYSEMKSFIDHITR